MNEKKSISDLLNEIRDISDMRLCWILEANSLLNMIDGKTQPMLKELAEDLIKRLP